MPPKDGENRPGRMFDGFLLMLTAAAMAIAVVAAAAMATRPAGAPAGGEGPAVTTARVTLSEWAITGDLVVPPGEVRMDVHNAGTVIHNIALVDGPQSPDISAGESVMFDLGTLEAGSYEVICAIPGHKEAGMQATLVVTADPAGMGGAQAPADELDYAALDAAMVESVQRFPAETEGLGNQELEPHIGADGVKEFEITAAITPWEVEPGRVVDAWTYNGTVPGPMIRLEPGDRARVIVHNELPMGTNVHWHGVDLADSTEGGAALTPPLIEPGQSFVYEFEATRPAVGMYHARHRGRMQVPNGLFAVLLVGNVALPAGQTIGGLDLPEDIELALEVPMVLNDAGVIGLSLNGKSFPATRPLEVDRGDWLLIHYFNEGLQPHPMRLDGFGQLVVAKDGFPLDHPFWADTVNISPGERYSVLVRAEEPGVWMWHCETLDHIEGEEGMVGMLTALIVDG